MNRTITGIIWVGPVFDRGGYGNMSRNYLLGFRRIGFPVRVVNYGPRHDKDIHPDIYNEIKTLLDTDAGHYPIGVVNLTPDIFPNIKFNGVAKKVGCTIFETDRIPQHWVQYCNRMDELWVPSRFNFETFSRSGVEPQKMKIVPIPVDTYFFKPQKEKLYIEGQKKFTFLYTFAFNWRKGFDLLLEAYLKEFSSKDNVSLILKVYEDQGVKRNELKEMILHSVVDKVDLTRNDLPHYTIIDEPLGQEDLRRLYNSCDLYVSTDRANGWGMPCMEAMAMGKPAATIDWSGSTEFMKENNSLLIKPTGSLVPVDRRLAGIRPLYYSGQRWAEVSVDEVRRVLRFASGNPEMLGALAQSGTKDIRERFSVERIARYIVENTASPEIGHEPLRKNEKPDVIIRPRWLRAVRKVVLPLLWKFKKYNPGIPK
jgi:glycosyltransferase involved in cell wall biosynthesis